MNESEKWEHFGLNIDDNQDKEYIINKIIDKYKCNKSKQHIGLFRNILFIFIIITALLTSLMFLASTLSSINVYVDNDIGYEGEITFYNSNMSKVENISSDADYFNRNYYISNIQIYLNSFASSDSGYNDFKFVIYGEEYRENDNTLCIDVYNGLDNTSTIDELSSFYSSYNCPTEYVISFIKITVKNNYINNNSSMIEFYRFFDESEVISTKNQLVLRININNLLFDNTYYDDWYNWRYNNGDIPNGYPFGIDISVVNYFYIYNPIDKRNYYFRW